jgi:nicotinate-nucleotide adenylyltransferase
MGIELLTLMPAAIAPYKPQAEDPGPHHRLEMSRLLVQGGSGLSVCDLEIERGGPSYTVDSLREIHASHPDTELTFIAGADTASTIAGWREPQALLELAHLAVAARGPSSRERVLDAVSSVPRRPAAPAPRIDFLDMPAVEISSSEVRRRAARGEPLEELVGDAVAGYIARHALYRAGEDGG